MPWRDEHRGGHRGFRRPSMGPRHECRGEAHMQGRTVGTKLPFNGATARMPWRGRLGSWSRSGSRCFNGATARMPWRGSIGETSPGHFSTLQWGHGTNAVESGAHGGAGGPGRVASMGPRHECRGEGEAWLIPYKRSELQWGHGTNAVERALGGQGGHSRDCASMGPRHECRGEAASGPIVTIGAASLQWGHGTNAVESKTSHGFTNESSPLQWGHGTNAVESRRRERLPLHVRLASMGPRHECRGERRPWGRPGGRRSGFNGATARMPWRG